MKRYSLLLWAVTVLVATAVGAVVSCSMDGSYGSSTGTDEGDDPAPTVTTTTTEIVNFPADGTPLPDIGETVSHTVDWEIADEEFYASRSYRLTGYFRAAGALVEVHSAEVTEQSGSTTFAFELPSGFPPTPGIVEPYRFFVQLSDVTDTVPMELADSSDAVYDRWAFEGDWYTYSNYASKTSIGGKWFVSSSAPPEVGTYRPTMKGVFQNLPGDGIRYEVTHEWDPNLGSAGAWIESELAGQYATFHVARTGAFLEVTDEAGNTVMHHRAEPYTFTADYAGKWWSGDAPIEPDDNGVLLEMTDDYLFVRRDEQKDYPTVALGPVVAEPSAADPATGTLTFTATHTRTPGPAGMPVYETVDPPVSYQISYAVSPSGDTLSLTSDESTILADPAGRDYGL